MTTTLRVLTAAAAGFTALTNAGAQADPALEAQMTRGRTAFSNKLTISCKVSSGSSVPWAVCFVIHLTTLSNCIQQIT